MESIAHLMAGLPEGYEEDCIATGAIQRKRGVSCPADLMMLGIFHLNNGCSLLEISEVARITKLGKMSDVAVMKRFEKCGDWFSLINKKLITNGTIAYQKPAWMEGKIVGGLDASDVTEKGRSGRLYRLHYFLDIFTMGRLEHLITTQKTGESLCNFTLKPDYLVIADRAYSSAKGMLHCINAGAEFILRMRVNSFTTRDANGQKIDVAQAFSSLKEGECGDITAFATLANGTSIPVRICAKRKDGAAIAKAHKKSERKRRNQQKPVPDGTKAFNEYIIVVTNLMDGVSAEEILEAYRYRWQIEIYFKRLKSIMNFGEMPKRRENSVIAWLNGKLMVALLIENFIARVSFFPNGDEKQEHLA